MSPWWLLLIVPAALVLGAFAGVCLWALSFLREWNR